MLKGIDADYFCEMFGKRGSNPKGGREDFVTGDRFVLLLPAIKHFVDEKSIFKPTTMDTGRREGLFSLGFFVENRSHRALTGGPVNIRWISKDRRHRSPAFRMVFF